MRLMRRLLLFVAAALVLSGCVGSRVVERGEYVDEVVIHEGVSARYEIASSLPVDYADDMEWILRYDSSDVEELRQRAATEDKECDVLFFGSSSIRLWRTLEEDMAPLKVVNRGYGGAMLRDIHYYYETVLADYRPRAFVFYCDNDLGGFGRDLHPTELFDLYRLLVERLKADYPECPIYFLAIKFNDSRLAKREEHRLFNAIMSDFAAHTEGVSFVDVNSPLLNEDGSVNNAYFESDMLHVNREGYAVWSSILRPMLLEELGLDAK